MSDVERWLRRASELSDLPRVVDPTRFPSTETEASRLETKIDMSPAGIEARLREASDLLELCLRLAASRPLPDLA